MANYSRLAAGVLWFTRNQVSCEMLFLYKHACPSGPFAISIRVMGPFLCVASCGFTRLHFQVLKPAEANAKKAFIQSGSCGWRSVRGVPCVAFRGILLRGVSWCCVAFVLCCVASRGSLYARFHELLHNLLYVFRWNTSTSPPNNCRISLSTPTTTLHIACTKKSGKTQVRCIVLRCVAWCLWVGCC
jgi:hypothetical protein